MRTLPLLLLGIGLVGCPSPDTGVKTDDTAPPTGETDDDGDGYSVEEGDCDDTNPNVHPGGTEVPCDGLDNDCSGGDDLDADGDGHDCEEYGGDDCDDDDADFHPGADDECGDFIDHDCDEDDECDCDEDGYEGEQCGGDDCHDDNADAYPGAKEDACYDGIDGDCDGGDDYDCDGDGFTSAEYHGNDCEDADASIYPGAEDICYDGVDSDCSDNSDYDCDQDGYDSDEYGGDDCDDDDAEYNPGAADICGDGFDQDCDGTIDNADYDGDGYVDEDCGGDDCDDSDATVYPDADETSIDGLDNDCDGETDEDAYCNLYSPLSNGSSATRSYDMTRDGTSYTEDVIIASWDAKTGEGIIERTMTDTTGMATILDEYVSCDATGVELTQVDYIMHGSAMMSAAFSDPRTFLLDEASMTAGTSWSFSYEAADATMGALLEADGVYTVIGADTITTKAGTFDCLVIENDYTMTDLGKMTMGMLDREVVATMYWVERLGMVYTEEVDVSGSTVETRELTSYKGFYP